jgi:hypothetical protein
MKDAFARINKTLLNYMEIIESAYDVQLPNYNNDLPADVGVLHYHGIQGSKLVVLA